MATNRFTGPLFIVGMPRSGTKLLRDLLNQNPKIGIPTIESHLIPYMIDRFGNPPKFEKNDAFDQFYEAFTQTSFFWHMKKTGRVLNKNDIDKVADRTSWRSIFEVILRFYAPQGRDEDFIWGDKTPGYLSQMNLLKALYPEARFLHIIRDARDYCLSIKKTWGKSLYRAADRWRQTLETARANSQQFGVDYMEVLYESLLGDAKKVLTDICKFLDCQFIPDMTQLAEPSENHGAAKGQIRIVRENQKKYLTQLSSSQVRRIEEIVYPVAKSIGYEFEYDVAFSPLSPPLLKLLMWYDGWASVKFHINEKGLRQGLGYFVKLHRQARTGLRT